MSYSDSMFAISVVSFMVLVGRVTLLVGIESRADFAHLRGETSVRKSDVDSHSVFVVSGLRSNVVELVGSGYNLGWDSNDFIGIVLMSNFGVDGGSETVDEGNVFSCGSSALYSSGHRHLIKRY